MGNHKELSELLRLWGFEGDSMVFDDGSLGFAMKLSSVDISCLSDEAKNDLKTRVAQFLNGLPPHTDIQFVGDITRGSSEVIEEHERLVASQCSEEARALARGRVSEIREKDESSQIPRHDLYCFVRKPMATALIDRPKLFGKKTRYQAIADERLSMELSQLAQLRASVIQGLASLGVAARPLDAQEVMSVVYDQWNPDRAIGIGSFDPQDVRGALLFTDAGVLDRGFVLGDTQYRIISLKQMPDQTYSGMAEVLRGLPMGARFFVTIHVPDQNQEIETLQRNRRIAFSMARGKRTGVADLESEAKLQDLETLLEQMIAQGERVFRVSVNILFRDKDASVLDESVAATLATIRSMGGAEAMEETLASFLIFTELSLPNARALERSRRMKTSNLADLLPLYGPWEGMRTPSVLLRSGSGSLFKFDPFDADLTNANQLVSGGSGAGKSFLTNLLLMQALQQNPRVFFVDIGGSYQKLCENLCGQYVALGVNSGVSINPFDLLPGEARPSNQKIKFLLGLIELMTKEDEAERLPKLSRSEIEDTIQRVYDKVPSPRLSDLRTILLEHSDVEIRRYGRILGSWCGETPFGQFIDRPTSIELNRPIVAFDLKGMEAYPELQAVCLFIITDLVWREVQRDRESTKYLVFDECWKLLKNDAGLVFIEEVFRTFRKYRASAIAISQDIDDFAKSKISGAILPNCSIKWLLMQPQADGKRLAEVLNLNPNEIAIVKSLHQEKGKYSQAFLIAQKNRALTVIESTPLEYWIATTDPKDLAAIERDKREHPDKSNVDRLVDLSVRYPNGVAASERKGVR